MVEGVKGKAREDSRHSFSQADVVDYFLSLSTQGSRSASWFAVRMLVLAQKGLFLSSAEADSSSENGLGGRSIPCIKCTSSGNVFANSITKYEHAG